MYNNYVVREFYVIKRSDYSEFFTNNEFDYNVYIALLFKDGTVKVENKFLSNSMFNEIYTSNFC